MNRYAWSMSTALLLSTMTAIAAPPSKPLSATTTKVAAIVEAIGRADAELVKAKTGFTIGGVSPVGHVMPPVQLIDRELFRFDEIWAAAGHPNGVFKLSPQQLGALTGAPVHDVVIVQS